MQDRYVGDVGDYVKYGLLRMLAPGHRLGVAWYLHPDEAHNDDGKHDAYLKDPEAWAQLDAPLFDAMGRIRGRRGGVADVEVAGLLPGAVYSNACLNFRGTGPERGAWRRRWFEGVVEDLADCDLVFADPDNGLCPDHRFRHGRYLDWKRLPKAEADALASRRCAVLYHHNTRYKGGHAVEIQSWLRGFPDGTLALRARSGTSRTFFVVNPSPDIEGRVVAFAQDWAAAQIELHRLEVAPC